MQTHLCDGIAEVRGSIPLVSTNEINNLRQSERLPFLFPGHSVTKILFLSKLSPARRTRMDLV